MEECLICCTVFSTLKELSCHHKLCNACYLKLDKPNCPYCRTTINYTKEEIIKRNQNISQYYRWQPPTQLLTIESRSIRRQINHSNINIDIDIDIDVNITSDIPFSRIDRQRNRRRRRNLSKEEVLDKRANIKKRCKKKWKTREGRLSKNPWYEFN